MNKVVSGELTSVGDLFSLAAKRGKVLTSGHGGRRRWWLTRGSDCAVSTAVDRWCCGEPR